MTLALTAAALLALTALACAREAPTPQELMKVCAEEWNSLKSANQAGGMVYQDFVRECLARHRAAADRQNAAPSTAPAPPPRQP